MNGVQKTGYTYDAYGNCTVSYGYSNEISRINPIRYRGYYLDRETGLYYLNARYYNPEWRRFISPANVSALNPKAVNGLNLYVYAENHPVDITYSTQIYTYQFGANAYSGYSHLLNTNNANHISNLFGALYTLSTVFGTFDKISNSISGAIDGGLSFLGKNGLGFNAVIPYANALSKYGMTMALISSGFSYLSSAYNNFNNSNYSFGEGLLASNMDARYYTLKTAGSLYAGAIVGDLAIIGGTYAAAGGVMIAYTLGFGMTGMVIGGLVAGVGVATIIGVAGAGVIYLLSEGADLIYEEIKKILFGG